MDLEFSACTQCGAFIVVTVNGEKTIDSRERHDQWHENLRRVITGNTGPLGSFDARRTAGI